MSIACLYRLQCTCACFGSCSRLDFRRFHRNRFVPNGSDGVHRTTFQPSSNCCRHFRFHLMRIRSVSENSFVRFPILLNSRIKIVRAHFPWSNFYLFHSDRDLRMYITVNKCRSTFITSEISSFALLIGPTIPFEWRRSKLNFGWAKIRRQISAPIK